MTEMDWGRPTLPCDDPSASKAKRTKRAAAAIITVNPHTKSLRGAFSMAANEVMHSMVSRPGVSGLLLVAGSHLFGEQTRRERLERLARRDHPPPTTDDPALWYDNNVAVNAAQATALALATSGQAGNPLWFTERGKRITASVAHSILRLRETTNPARLVQSIITRANDNTEVMQYGRDHEAVALDTYRMFRMDRGHSPQICSLGLVVTQMSPGLVLLQTLCYLKRVALLRLNASSLAETDHLRMFPGRKGNFAWKSLRVRGACTSPTTTMHSFKCSCLSPRPSSAILLCGHQAKPMCSG